MTNLTQFQKHLLGSILGSFKAGEISNLEVYRLLILAEIMDKNVLKLSKAPADILNEAKTVIITERNK